jgi:metal-responsive CopG/Arc/MetJ family transcriptional regulator
MTDPVRITVALDKKTFDLLETMRKETDISRSEMLRQSFRFYTQNKSLLNDKVRKKIEYYIELLDSGEHIILDVDHWILLLNLIDTSPDKEKF